MLIVGSIYSQVEVRGLHLMALVLPGPEQLRTLTTAHTPEDDKRDAERAEVERAREEGKRVISLD